MTRAAVGFVIGIYLLLSNAAVPCYAQVDGDPPSLSDIADEAKGFRVYVTPVRFEVDQDCLACISGSAQPTDESAENAPPRRPTPAKPDDDDGGDEDPAPDSQPVSSEQFACALGLNPYSGPANCPVPTDTGGIVVFRVLGLDRDNLNCASTVLAAAPAYLLRDERFTCKGAPVSSIRIPFGAPVDYVELNYGSSLHERLEDDFGTAGGPSLSFEDVSWNGTKLCCKVRVKYKGASYTTPEICVTACSSFSEGNSVIKVEGEICVEDGRRVCVEGKVKVAGFPSKGFSGCQDF